MDIQKCFEAKTWSVLCLRVEFNYTLLNNAKQLQSNRQGQDDHSEKADVAVHPVHPLGWV